MTEKITQSTSAPATPTSPTGPSGGDVTQRRAKFVTGSIFRHVVTMTATGAVGMIAVFAVDLANLFYISLLGQAELAAAIGYSATIMFFNNALSIGMMIGGSAVIARAVGEERHDLAKRRAGSALIAVFLMMIVMASVIFSFIPELLTFIGARDNTHTIATSFLSIVIPSMPFLGLSMMLAGIMRANGDAKGSMYVTLAGGFASAVLDPIFIFGFGLGIEGAAIASILSRFVMIAVGIRGTVQTKQLISRPTGLADLLVQWRVLFPIAIPAILTNIATPVGNAYVTMAIADFGDDAVAGWAIVGRIQPLAWTALFALSGSVGPIFGQNLGAGLYDRVRMTLRDSMYFILGYSAVVWLILFFAQDLIVRAFGATGGAADFVRFFCTWIAPSGIFMGFLFVSNAAFNNLGYPAYSTAFNWGRSTLGTVPTVMLGTYLAGAEGAILGQAAGAVLFGFMAILSCFRVINRKQGGPGSGSGEPTEIWYRRALSPFSSAKGNM
ncbi:MATE family efflux transporter [uncultured Cohaesibacter sp.]|uniref:MATE family efflux transporter n=1 Tax=uncultured Cohaesibacter sp. TaxID=1002546 RepID=UPI0029C7D8A1|nr:MATE family efflux transporter [uncultured Cohaesibacter sp.]